MRIRLKLIPARRLLLLPPGVAAALMILFMAPCATAASTLLDYEKRVVMAGEQIERIKADRAHEEEGLTYIRGLLPPEEAVSFEAESVQVDNSWLHVLLDTYEEESDSETRLEILNEAGGRLRALDAHLREAGAAAGQEAGANDSREKIKEILSRSEYREKGEDRFTTYIKELRARIWSMITDFFSSLFQMIFGSKGVSSLISKVVIVLMLAAAAYLVYALARKIPLARKRSKKRILMGEEIEANMTAEGLAAAARDAAGRGDFRTGVRNLYLSLLYELAELGIIELEPYTTNHEYLVKVSGRSTLSAPMLYLTERFDYFWYGMFASSEQDFNAYLEKYEEAITQARRASESQAGA